MKIAAVPKITGIILLTVSLLFSNAYGARKQVIKIATLTPEGSPWMEVFNTINAEVMEKTAKKVSFRVYAGGVLGDEQDLIRKMYIGQIQGAVITASSLTTIFNEMDVLQVPFLFQGYDEVDHVLLKMDAFFKKGFEDNGYILLGWSEGGFIRIMSIAPMATLDDLRKGKVWVWADAPMAKAIFKEAKVSGIPLSVPDVLVGLQTGLVDVVYAPPAGAISLQWFTKIKYVTDVPLMYLTGSIIVKKEVFNRLSVEHQAILIDTFQRHMGRFKEVVRKGNRDALQVMTNHGIQLVDVSKDEIEAYKKLSERAVQQPGSRRFSDAALKQISTYLQEYRRDNQ
jgi:TRAP-type C4-dicarboxylate transport system substrate-binding protein